MTIDLTGEVPRVLDSCDACSRDAVLYRLVGTQQVLCSDCFVAEHVAS